MEKTRIQGSQYARSLIEASLDPLFTISPEGKITDINNASRYNRNDPGEIDRHRFF
jgi:hypothetical protein